jgi:hypothetical protein
MPWFNGDIEALIPGHWVLVVSLNHQLNPENQKSLDFYGDRRFDPRSFWNRRRTFNTDSWYRSFFGPLAQVAARALGGSLSREEESGFATTRMLFVEICPYGSNKFSLTWAAIKELLEWEPGFQLAARVNQLLIEHGQPALVLVNGKRAIDMFEHLYVDELQWADVHYDSPDPPKPGTRVKRLWHKCGVLRNDDRRIPVVGIPFLRKPSTHNSNAEITLLGKHFANCLAGESAQQPSPPCGHQSGVQVSYHPDEGGISSDVPPAVAIDETPRSSE